MIMLGSKRSVRRGRTARTALVGALVAGSMLSSVAQAAYPGTNGRIAFIRNGDVYSIKTDGTGMRLLAAGGRDSGPRWSPHGTRIAYLDRGDLWVMNADGSGKQEITSAAPSVTDSRPSWSPNGRYLAFVETARHATSGHVVRYDTMTGTLTDFTTTVSPGGTIDVTALPAPVAWAEADNAAGTPAYFIVYEGAGALCRAGYSCLDTLGLSAQSQYANGFPSSEESAQLPRRWTDPDWYPVNPAFDTGVLTSVESCTTAGCTHAGLSASIGGATVLPGAYDGVYSPDGRDLAYVLDAGSAHRIWISPASLAGPPRLLATGTDPDWQPTAPF
jgi:dipeptidyl aminopeptidase/acylaminoacyl peptidase